MTSKDLERTIGIKQERKGIEYLLSMLNEIRSSQINLPLYRKNLSIYRAVEYLEDQKEGILSDNLACSYLDVHDTIYRMLNSERYHLSDIKDLVLRADKSTLSDQAENSLFGEFVSAAVNKVKREDKITVALFPPIPINNLFVKLHNAIGYTSNAGNRFGLGANDAKLVASTAGEFTGKLAANSKFYIKETGHRYGEQGYKSSFYTYKTGDYAGMDMKDSTMYIIERARNYLGYLAGREDEVNEMDGQRTGIFANEAVDYPGEDSNALIFIRRVLGFIGSWSEAGCIGTKNKYQIIGNLPDKSMCSDAERKLEKAKETLDKELRALEEVMRSYH